MKPSSRHVSGLYLLHAGKYKENNAPSLTVSFHGRNGSKRGAGDKLALGARSISEEEREPLRPIGSIQEQICTPRLLKLQLEQAEAEENEDQDKEGEMTAQHFPPPTPSMHLSRIWDEPGCEVAAPASSWSILGNRTLLCRPLPLDVGRCVCYILREIHHGCSVYFLYTDEGNGRQDRRLAVAHHSRRFGGRSRFLIFFANSIFDNNRGRVSLRRPHFPSSDPSALLGRMEANLIGSRYNILGEVNYASKGREKLLGVVVFKPTIATLMGTYRVMHVSLPKHQSILMSSSTQEKNDLQLEWEVNAPNVHQLYSKRPSYNKVTRQYELDFRSRAKIFPKIRTSTKNLQLTMDEDGKQPILMLGKIGKYKYVMEYCFPLTGFQAFAVCLASLDSKLCCSF